MGEDAVGLGESTPVLSLLHIRPLLPAEQAAGCCSVVTVGENETVNVQGRPYAFDCVVGEGGHSRSHMCEHYIRPLVRNVCSGVNCAVFAYGQTSSGKTYTMGIGKEQLQALSGGNQEAARDLVIPYALRQLFQNVQAAQGLRTFTLLVSFVEVYMEKYYDLLAQRQPVVAKTSRDGEMMLVGAQLRQVTSLEEVIRLLQIGGHSRITKGTNQNDRSSRSHAVFTIHVQSRAAATTSASAGPTSAASTPAASNTPLPGSPAPAAAGAAAAAAAAGASTPPPAGSPAPATPAAATPSPVRSCAAVGVGGTAAALSAALAAPPLAAKLHLVDLAGSESVGRAGTVGLAAKEGNNINLSLMTLRNLIQLLAAPKAPGAAAAKVVLPYRDSKLTTLLRDALGGNSSTLFVACVSPADANAAMTASTLEFATTARRIRTKPAVNIGGNGSNEVLELHRIILKLRNELEQLRRQAASGTPASPITALRKAAAASRTPGLTFPSPSPSNAAPGTMMLAVPHSMSPLPKSLSCGGTPHAARSPFPQLPGTQGFQGVTELQQQQSSDPATAAAEAAAGGVRAAADVAATAAAVAAEEADVEGGSLADSESEECGHADGSGSEEGGAYDAAAEEEPGTTQGEEQTALARDGTSQAASGDAPLDGAADPEARVHHRRRRGRDSGSHRRSSSSLHASDSGGVGGGGVRRSSGRQSREHNQTADPSSQRRSHPPHERRQLGTDGAAADVTSAGYSPASASATPRSLRRSHSEQSLVSGLSGSAGRGCRESVLSFSSYGGSGGGGSAGSSPDVWQGMAQLQQRVVLLEAENEHLQKHVANLSSVVCDLRAQLDDAHAALAVKPPQPPSLPNSPLVPPPRHRSASINGLPLTAQSAQAAAARWQRFGVSLGGVVLGSDAAAAPAGGAVTNRLQSAGTWAAMSSSSRDGALHGGGGGGGGSVPGQLAVVSAAGREGATAPRRASWSGPVGRVPRCLFQDKPEEGQSQPLPHATTQQHEGSLDRADKEQQGQREEKERGLGQAEDSEEDPDLASPSTMSSASSLELPSAADVEGADADGGGDALAEAVAAALAATAGSTAAAAAGTPTASAALQHNQEQHEEQQQQHGKDEDEAGQTAAAAASGCESSTAAEVAEDTAVAAVMAGGQALQQPQQVAAVQVEGGEQASLQLQLAELPALEELEDRPRALLTWISEQLSETELMLDVQRAVLRELLTQQGLINPAAAAANGGGNSRVGGHGSGGCELPSLEVLHGYAAQQLAGVRAELAAVGAAVAAEVEEDDGGHRGDGTAEVRRVEELLSRRGTLEELWEALRRAAELEASLELQREVQMLVGAYARLYGSDSLGLATGPAVARAAAAAEQQLQTLRRHRRQQVMKEAAVAREKLRELDAMSGPPLPQQYGVVLHVPYGSSGGGSAASGALSSAPSLSAQNSLRSSGLSSMWSGGGSSSHVFSQGSMCLEGGEEADEEVEPSDRTSTGVVTSSPYGCGGGGNGSGSSSSGVAGAPGLPPPHPPSGLPPPAPSVAPQQPTPSIFAQLLPSLNSSWRRSGSRELLQQQQQQQHASQQQQQHLPPPPQQPVSHPQHHPQRSNSLNGSHQGVPQRRTILQLCQLGPWLDALLDYETRMQHYSRVLKGALQEREAVYSQLQVVERELHHITEAAAAAAGLPPASADNIQAAASAAAAAVLAQQQTPPSYAAYGGYYSSSSGNTNACMEGRTEGGASFAAWAAMSPFAGCDPALRQHAAALGARQAKLQKRLEELCRDVASLQLAIVEAQEAAGGASAAASRDDWWACVPSLSLARPALRLMLERAAGYRGEFHSAVARADELEHRVAELELQFQEAEARLAAHSLELTAIRAAALATGGAHHHHASSSSFSSSLQHHPHNPQHLPQLHQGTADAAVAVANSGYTAPTSLLLEGANGVVSAALMQQQLQQQHAMWHAGNEGAAVVLPFAAAAAAAVASSADRLRRATTGCYYGVSLSGAPTPTRPQQLQQYLQQQQVMSSPALYGNSSHGIYNSAMGTPGKGPGSTFVV